MTEKKESSDKSFFYKLPILPTVKCSIVIPVKNEEKYIHRMLSSFVEQKGLDSKPLDLRTFDILILANNCTDNSVSLIKDFQKTNPDVNIYLEEVTLPPHQANIGYVRRELMDSACRRLCENGGGIIMTTDGDTTVTLDWIAQTKLEICGGAEAVGGRILLYENEFAALDNFTQMHHSKDEDYQLLIAEIEGRILDLDFDPVPRHHQHFNGSFAITTDCYLRSGGVPNVEYLEDCAFFEQLQKKDTKVRHSDKVLVYTSARCIGRTEIGLSYQLNLWKKQGNHLEDFFVESASSIIRKLIQKKMLIDLWKIRDHQDSYLLPRIKKILPGITKRDESYIAFKQCPYFGEWYDRLKDLKKLDHLESLPPVHIDKAILDLQNKIKLYTNYNFSQTSSL